MFKLDALATAFLFLYVPADVDPQEVQCLAVNVYMESRGEGINGKAAVASVVRNRVESSRFPNTYCGVVTQARTDAYGQPIRNKCHFSWFCDGKPDDIVLKNDIDIAAWVVSVTESVLTMHYNQPDFSKGATHYHTKQVAPCWSQVYDKTVVVGDHIFYKQNWNTCS